MSFLCLIFKSSFDPFDVNFIVLWPLFHIVNHCSGGVEHGAVHGDIIVVDIVCSVGRALTLPHLPAGGQHRVIIPALMDQTLPHGHNLEVLIKLGCNVLVNISGQG